jgi:2-dehydropantoate 2-reductase
VGKNLYNSTLNPLGAVLRVPYGKLAESRHATQIMNRLIEEIFGVMRRRLFHLLADAETYQKEFYGKILPPTYGHRSSTLQDVERKVKTEIESLNGLVVRLGDQYGRKSPATGRFAV